MWQPKNIFHFHRLVFGSQEEADQVYSQVGVIEPMPKRRLDQLVTTPPKDQVIREFTRGIYYKKRPLYVLEKSRKNLDIIRGM